MPDAPPAVSILLRTRQLLYMVLRCLGILGSTRAVHLRTLPCSCRHHRDWVPQTLAASPVQIQWRKASCSIRSSEPLGPPIPPSLVAVGLHDEQSKQVDIAFPFLSSNPAYFPLVLCHDAHARLDDCAGLEPTPSSLGLTMTKKKPAVPKPKASAPRLAESKAIDAKRALGTIQQANTNQVVRCAENILLLDILSRSLPTTETSIRPFKARSKGKAESTRQLSYEQEDRLVKQLAFLSSISDDPSHVMAVCVQEIPQQRGCAILLAVNKACPDSAQDVLDRARRGLQRVFNRLRQASPTSSDAEQRAVKEAVFNDIVALSRERIFSRMRSGKHKAYGFKKQKFLGTLLRNMSESPWRQRAVEQKVNMTEQDLEKHGRRIQTLLEAMELFEASDATPQQLHQDLANLVRHIGHFNERTPLRALLATLTNVDMQPEARERLLTCLRKIARYYEIAKFLCREARATPMLRNATVQTPKLPAEAFARTPSNPPIGTVASTLDRVCTKKQPTRLHVLPPRLQDILAKNPNAQNFTKQISQTLQQSKIHAEIQIISHCEGAGATVGLRPRVIASSKDACYLCHAFIVLHGQYRVPKTHGKLYKGWRLPATPRTWEPLSQRVSDFLEQQIRATVQQLCDGAALSPVKYANESTLFPLTVSTSLLSGMTNTYMLSNHSRLNLTAITHVPAVIEGPSQASVRALGARISGPSLRSLPAVEVDAAASLVQDQKSSDGGVHVQECNPMTADPVHMDHRIDATGKTLDPLDGVCAPATRASPALDYKDVSNHADNHQKTPEIVSLAEPPSASKSEWFRYKNLEIFVDETSAKFVHTCLGRSEAEKALRDNAIDIPDISALGVGIDINLPEDLDGNSYFACGDTVVMIDTKHVLATMPRFQEGI